MIEPLQGLSYFNQVAAGAAAQLPSQPLRMVRFQSSGGTIYMGSSAASAANNVGWPMVSGYDTGWIPCANLSEFWFSGAGTLCIWGRP